MSRSSTIRRYSSRASTDRGLAPADPTRSDADSTTSASTARSYNRRNLQVGGLARWEFQASDHRFSQPATGNAWSVEPVAVQYLADGEELHPLVGPSPCFESARLGHE